MSLLPNPFRLPIPNTKPGPSGWSSYFARPVLTGNPERRCPRGLEVQTILFPVDEFTAKQAKAWAKKEGFRYGKVYQGDTQAANRGSRMERARTAWHNVE